jgi:hypothetical protein
MFRTHWKCKQVQSLSIYQNAKPHHFRHAKLHTLLWASYIYTKKYKSSYQEVGSQLHDPSDLGPENHNWCDSRYSYKSAVNGIILSPWIQGSLLSQSSMTTLKQNCNSYLDFCLCRWILFKRIMLSLLKANPIHKNSYLQEYFTLGMIVCSTRQEISLTYVYKTLHR